ncbi:MAG: TatD family hydrolase [Patescibacteria group bacterium]
MFDTHSHVNFNAYKNDFAEVIARAKQKNLTMVNVGSQLSTSGRAVDLAEKFENCYAAVGLHPIQLEDMEVEEEGVKFTARKENFDYNVYRELAGRPKVVAIGECGLDYHHIYDEARREEIIANQKKVFIEHIKLANELNLPLIVHCRGTKENIDSAYLDIYEILKEHKPKVPSIMHCYVGPVSLVEKFLELGFYLSFNGVLTFDKTGKLEEILLSTPMAKVLTETDCPYLTPSPYRGQRNEPIYVEYVINKIADIKKMPIEEVLQITDRNAKEVFHI